MLHLYTAWDLEELANCYLETTSSIPQQPFSRRIVITPNMMIGRWLQMQAAQFSGISVNLEPVLAASYTWKLMREAFPDLPKESLFSSELLQFSILELLEDKEFTKAFTRLDNYLNVCAKADLMVLAGKVARIFDHYQVYRSDWLESWAKVELLGLGEDEAWQQAMWIEIIKSNLANDSSEYSKKYRSQLEEELLKAVQDKKLELHEPLFIFGVPNLPTSFIKLIKALSQSCEVYLFAFASIQDSQPIESIPFEVKHWHRTGLEFLSQLPDERKFIGKEDGSSTQLEQLKSCLVGASSLNGEESNKVKDSSIHVVNCFSEMREVEALYDYLLNQFAQDPELKCDDVLVAVSDLEAYAPYIRAVFDLHSGEQETASQIPYVINGSLSAVESPLINGLLKLLELPHWRFTREQVMVLARNRLIQRRFSFDDDTLDQIDVWLDEAGVRWGIDAEHKTSLGLPPSNLNTWRSGLDRMLLGSVLPKAYKSDLPLYKDVLPVDEIEGELSLVLGEFVRYCESLFYWREVLLSEYSPADWQLIFQEMLKDLFSVDEREESTHLQLLELFDSLSAESAQLNFENKVDAQSMAALLGERISSTERTGRFSGVVNFTSMNNLAGVPFKQVCLLGMNYDTWPSQQRDPGFDLLNSGDQLSDNHRVGDRNKSSEDRYLTLQLILSAKSVFYMSYIGRDMQTGAEKPPSVLVSEIKDFCELRGIGLNYHLHPMHSYSPANYLSKSDSSFDVLKAHSDSWLNVANRVGQGEKEIQPLFPINDQGVSELESIEQLDFDDLCLFFQNPQSNFLRNQLSVYIRDESNDWENTEPFDLSNFADSSIRNIALRQSLVGHTDTSLKMARASQLLPHGIVGEVLQAEEQDKVDLLIEGVKEEYPEFFEKELKDVPFDLTIGSVNLTGVLSNLSTLGQITVISDKIYDYRKVELWLRHLVLCCVKPNGVSLKTRLIGLESSLGFDVVESPEVLLSKWVDAYVLGQAVPLPFFAKSSLAYAEEFNKKNDPDSALKKAEGKWNDNFYFPGENSKPPNQFLYRGHSPLNELFSQTAESLLCPLLKAEGE